jgi:hypothetical protein
MVEKRQDAFFRVLHKAQTILEQPALSASFSESPDISLMVQPSFDNWETWHVWLDDVKQMAIASRILWHRNFDAERFSDPFAGLKHSWKETPTMESSSHAPPYKTTEKHLSTIIGAVPAAASTSGRGIVLDGIQRNLTLRLPLGTLILSWNMSREEWQRLSWGCDDFRAWLATTPIIKN